MKSIINVLCFALDAAEVHQKIFQALSEKEEIFHFNLAQNFEEFYFFLDKYCNVAILDTSLSRDDLKYAIKKIKEKKQDIPIIILVPSYSDSQVDSFFKLGIKDILRYDEINKLFHTIIREYETQKLLNERRELLFSSQMNEELYRSLIELQSGFIRKITATGNYIYANQAYCDYLKKSRKEIYSENLFLTLPAVSREAYMRHIKSLTPQKSSATIEYFTYSEEGLKYQVWTDHGIFDSLGRLQSVIGVGQDITETKLLEKERREIDKKLRKSEKDFRDMALNVPGVIFQFKISQKKSYFTYVSPKSWEILQIFPEDLKKRISALRIYKEDRKLFFQTLRQNLQKKSSINLECRIQTNEKIIWIQIVANRIHSHEILYNGVILDISARKEVEINLEKQKQLFSNLFHFSPVGIAIVDTEGNFLNANQAFFDITGYASEDLSFINISNLFSESDKDTSTSLIDSLSNQEEYEIKTKSYIKKIVLVRSTLLDYVGEFNSKLYIVTFLDITQQKLLEEKLTQKNKMESIGNLASSIAHDFNNFLQPIILASNMISEELKHENNIRIDKIQKYNQNIIDSAEKSRNLVAQVLDFARKSSNNYTKIEITKVIQNSFQSILNSYPNEKIHSKILIHEKNLYTIGDPFAINQVILNLFTNSLDAMKDQKEKIIELEIKSIPNHGILKSIITDASKLIYIRFTDNGIGIPKEKINYIFEPFYTNKAHGKGTGLGLSIVYGIINRMRGAIQVESAVGLGTSFLIYVPQVEN